MGELAAGVAGRSTAATRITVVVPVLNSMRYLPRTAPALLDAARRSGGVRIVYVDNGSTDGSPEYLESLASDLVLVLRRPATTIGSMRNSGARAGVGAYLSFLDSDCAVVPGYFDEAVAALAATGADATGAEVDLPDEPHWIERTLHALHYTGRDRDVVYLNSANFFVARAAFERVGGFREDLRTGEDADIGQRLIAAGLRIRECPRVRAVHLGNPRSLREYYRRSVWHGLGMFATVTPHRIDRPTAMLAVHLAATLAGVATLAAGRGGLGARVAVAVLLQLAVPAATVAFRALQTGRLANVPAAVLLYWLYYWARAQAAWLVLVRRAADYRR
jgi:cellulose synthase/poly-beta-1,6-N-acetylglucosamine synthase-like glycosyltransferase